MITPGSKSLTFKSERYFNGRVDSPGRNRAFASAFTLVELLIVLSVSTILLLALGSVLVNYLLNARSLEASQRLREDANRINYLIQVEASEASEIVAGPALDQCGKSGSSLFLLKIPKPLGTYANFADPSKVFYYAESGGLRRCGPPVNRNGTLNHAASPVDSLVSPSTQLTVRNSASSSCSGEVTNSRQVVFDIAFNNQYSKYAPSCAVARAKTIFVCNPPLAGVSPAVGDCP